MELKEGMYVRTKKGIGQIDETRIFMDKYFEFHLDSNKGSIHNVTDNTYWNNEENIIGEPSNNIIDLIEKNDFVNGNRVLFKDTGIAHNQKLVVCLGNDEERHIYDEHCIKSIVTKEQFESMSYKVVEE